MVKGIPLALGLCLLSGFLAALSNYRLGIFPLITALFYLSSLFIKPIEKGEVHFVQIILALPVGYLAFELGKAVCIFLLRIILAS